MSVSSEVSRNLAWVSGRRCRYGLSKAAPPGPGARVPEEEGVLSTPGSGRPPLCVNQREVPPWSSGVLAPYSVFQTYLCTPSGKSQASLHSGLRADSL